MSIPTQTGHPLGLHRVLDDPKVLPQNAQKLDPSVPLCSNEVLVAVTHLQIDAASFNQLKNECPHPDQMKELILKIVKERGKMQNPVTGSGGMLLGQVKEIGTEYPDQGLKLHSSIATLVSLTATPLELNHIEHIDFEKERLTVSGTAILFARSLYGAIPGDLSQGAALAAYDICGAPLLVCNHVKAGDTVFVLGLGKAGRSVLSGLHHRFSDQVRILACDAQASAVEYGKNWSAAHGRRDEDKFDVIDAQDPVAVMEWVEKNSDGKMADVSVNLVNVANTEMPTVLATKNRGKCLFFSMATDFQKAALGTEAVGLDVDLLMGVGYVEGHAQYMLEVIRGDSVLSEYFESNFGG